MDHRSWQASPNESALTINHPFSDFSIAAIVASLLGSYPGKRQSSPRARRKGDKYATEKILMQAFGERKWNENSAAPWSMTKNVH
jgi:hypothetical protein